MARCPRASRHPLLPSSARPPGLPGTRNSRPLAAVWAALLHRLTGETDVAFATPADLRRRSAFQPVVGYCLSPLVLRVDLSDDPSFTELMTTVRNELLDGLDHLIPFERIVRDQMAGESDGANPVYQTMFVLEPEMTGHDRQWSAAPARPALADAIGAGQGRPRTAARRSGKTAASPASSTTIAPALTVRASSDWIAAWLRLLEALADDPQLRISDVELGEAADHARLIEGNATTTERPPGTVAQQFAELAVRQPLAPALSADGISLSYGELHRAALKGAVDLRASGVREGDAVAICLPPSIGLVVAALAALSAGAGVLLLNPAESPEALAALASTAKARTVIVGVGDESTFRRKRPADVRLERRRR